MSVNLATAVCTALKFSVTTSIYIFAPAHQMHGIIIDGLTFNSVEVGCFYAGT